MKYTKKASDHIHSIQSADKRNEFINILDRAANRLAKKHGYGRATKIDIRKDSKCKVGKTVSFGWAKNSTGEYVPMSYVNKCYGKGVHYVHAEFEVQIGIKDLWLKS